MGYKSDYPELEDPSWGAPVQEYDGVMMCQTLKLVDGEWILPVSIEKGAQYNAGMVVSKYKGVTWKGQRRCIRYPMM